MSLMVVTCSPISVQISLVGCPFSSNEFCRGASLSLIHLLTCSLNMSWSALNKFLAPMSSIVPI